MSQTTLKGKSGKGSKSALQPSTPRSSAPSGTPKTTPKKPKGKATPPTVSGTTTSATEAMKVVVVSDDAEGLTPMRKTLTMMPAMRLRKRRRGSRNSRQRKRQSRPLLWRVLVKQSRLWSRPLLPQPMQSGRMFRKEWLRQHTQVSHSLREPEFWLLPCTRIRLLP